MDKNKKLLWLRWISANGISEMLGLGITFATIGLLSFQIDNQQTFGIVLSFIINVFCGAIEATFVGMAQWWAMNPWFPRIRCFDWWCATLTGTLISYSLGYLPSTLISMSEVANKTTIAEPPQWVILLLASGLGAVAGAVLSFAQWRVLRKKVNRAGLWIPANMLAWTFGMPIIFWGIDLAFQMTTIWQSVLIISGTLLVSGLLVGIIHGYFLIIIAEEN